MRNLVNKTSNRTGQPWRKDLTPEWPQLNSTSFAARGEISPSKSSRSTFSQPFSFAIGYLHRRAKTQCCSQLSSHWFLHVCAHYFNPFDTCLKSPFYQPPEPRDPLLPALRRMLRNPAVAAYAPMWTNEADGKVTTGCDPSGPGRKRLVRNTIGKLSTNSRDLSWTCTGFEAAKLDFEKYKVDHGHLGLKL